jgi:hypothetical protein
MVERAVNSSNSIDQIGNKLSRVGITHIMFLYDLFDSWINNNLDREQQGLLKLFFQKRVKKIKSYGGYGLFEPAPASSSRFIEATP